MKSNRWVIGARPKTLPAAIAPVLVGTAAVRPFGGPDIIWWRFLCALGVALFVQIATNYANDYSDGKRGTDDPATRVGPPRLVGNGLATAAEVKRAVIITFGLTILCGLPLVVWVNWRLALVGAAAVAAGWFYTGGPRPYGYAGFGELFVFVFFGLVATVGSAFVQTEAISWVSIVLGAMMGCWATALLVVNNLRDIPGDTASNKRTLAVRLGDQRTRILYVMLMAVPYLAVPIVGGTGGRPLVALALVGIVLSRQPILTVLQGAKGPALISVLVGTGRVQMLVGLVLTGALLFS